MSVPPTTMPARESTGRHAFLVAAGVILSRIMGLLRQRVFNHYFGLAAGDAFSAALRVPNFLQNLFGEGVLSASLIPVYSRLLAEKNEAEADRVAGAVGAILAIGSTVLVAVGVMATPYLMWAIAPGYHGEKREMVILLARILFPGTGLLVCSAWCLGILNSHRKFFLSYTAPVVWNLAMIATILMFRTDDLNALSIKLAWGTVVGCALQLAVQVPFVWRLAPNLRLRADTTSQHVRDVLRNFGPVALSRGVMQVSAYIDQALASLLGNGAMTAMTNAQSIYMLPVSLFGMSVSAAELPAMSSTTGGPDVLRARLNNGLRQIAFFIVPSAMAFFAFGDVITAVLYQSGRFTPADSVYVWGIVAGSAVGLLASTLGRLYQSTYYATRDSRTPLRFAVVRVVLTGVLGYLCAVPLPHWIGIEPRWGVAGLTASAGVAGWVEFALLRRELNRRIGPTGLPAGFVASLWGAAAAGAAAGWAIKLQVGTRDPLLTAISVLIPYGLIYFAITYLLRVDECATLLQRLKRLR
ncbi:MAG TPA: murein biosynthesis integral membrane protein MurJ [Candidatus Acidoferrum sp.]|nr:murein biosynthesis integral membrane protein MurJ [Candidatus Acidoferrum sp.]